MRYPIVLYEHSPIYLTNPIEERVYELLISDLKKANDDILKARESIDSVLRACDTSDRIVCISFMLH
jgi:hypothetical protein